MRKSYANHINQVMIWKIIKCFTLNLIRYYQNLSFEEPCLRNKTILTFNFVTLSINVYLPSFTLVISLAHSPDVSPSNSSFNLPWKAKSVIPGSAKIFKKTFRHCNFISVTFTNY